MKRIYEVACPHCRSQNKLPTSALCSRCDGTLGLFAGLCTLLANDQGMPEIGYSRMLSDAEVLSLSMNPWQLYGVPGGKIAIPRFIVDNRTPPLAGNVALKVVAGPNVRVKPDTTV